MTANPTPPEVPLVEAVFCRRCRRAVSTRIGPTGVTFLHAVELRGDTVDHRADPVPVTEIDNPLIECDFCSAPEAAWIYRCKRAELRRTQHSTAWSTALDPLSTRVFDGRAVLSR
jgi:hypothetical protein